MEKEQKQILKARRVELVDDIDITGGLYTHLLSRNILNKRSINNIKSNGPPEAQVEALLDLLAQRDCFDQFCEALKADDQEHIVKKYLKAPLSVPTTTESTTTPSADPSPSTSSSSTQPSANETTCLASSSKRLCSSPPTSVCMKEGDRQHIYVSYNQGASPNKRHREAELENTVARFEPGETRYLPKHFIAEETDQFNSCVALQPASRQVVILDNPQSIYHNPNIFDAVRYQAAFPSQNSYSTKQRDGAFQPPNMSSPLKDPSSRFNALDPSSGGKAAMNRNLFGPDGTDTHPSLLNLNHRSAQHGRTNSQEQDSGERNADVRNLLRPNITNTHSSLLNHPSAQPGNLDIRSLPSVTSNQYQHPQQYLSQAGILPKSKGFNPITASYTSLPSEQMDSVDTMTLKGSMQSVRPELSVCDIPTGDSNDSCSVSVPAAASVQSIDLTSLTPTPLSSLPRLSSGKSSQSISPDLDQIDLPDGCVNVSVEQTTRQFFMSSYKKAYPMRNLPRGYALIINVDEVEGKPPRKGTNFDRDNLCNLLSQLHFNIMVYNDRDGLSAQDIVNKLRGFAKMKEHNEMDACFVCLLSHGEEGYIFGTDGKRIPLDEIFMLFGNTNCKGLIGKPKVFIIQACRGGTLDKGVRMDEPDGGSLPMKAGSQLPSMSDMLICYPTLTGYYAWRNRARGSWYIEAIVQVFMRYAKNEDVCAMLNRVNQLVSRKVSESNHKEMNSMSQMSEYKSTLRQPHLYLFPGIGCTR